MSEHQSGAPERRPGMDGIRQSGSSDAAEKGYGQGSVDGYGEAPSGASQGQQGWGGQSESMWPPSGQGPFMHNGADSMPPGQGQAPYPPPAPGPWVGAPYQGYSAPPHFAPAPHAWAPPYMAPQYAPPYAAYAGYPPPPPGAYPPDAFRAMPQGHAYGAAQGAGQAHGARVSDLVEEVANGGNGLSTLSKMLNFDDPDFWKGALVGAAVVLLLTSDSVQHALFGSGANGNGAGSKESGT